jgi:hypothetical protein
MKGGAVLTMRNRGNMTGQGKAGAHRGLFPTDKSIRGIPTMQINTIPLINSSEKLRQNSTRKRTIKAKLEELGARSSEIRG